MFPNADASMYIFVPAHGAAAVTERFPEPSEAILLSTDADPWGRQHANRPVVGQTGARFGGAVGRRCRAAADPPETDDAVAASDHRAGQVARLTGAWFPAVLSRWRDAGGERLQQVGQCQEQNPEQQAAEATRAQRPAGQRQAVAQSDIAAPMSEPDWVGRADWSALRKTSQLVRPYTWTGGRTTSPVHLEVETLVSATGRPADPAGPAEHRTILGLCATPRSVAELAALLKMPLGVTRVLLGDLAAAGNVAVHRTAGSADTAADVTLMQRVITGLQRL